MSYKPKKSNPYTYYTPKAEINICLHCDLPTCKKQSCKRFETEKRRLENKSKEVSI